MPPTFASKVPTSLPLLARGGQADIFGCGEDRVIRVGRRPQDMERLRYEYKVYSLLGGTAVPVPRVFELSTMEGRTAIVMERLPGPSMMDELRARPFSARARAGELAELHSTVLATEVPPGLTDVKDKARHCVRRAEALDAGTRDYIVGIVAGLPDGRSLCHGDFHPGNIMRRNGESCIIDWSAASVGDMHADIAHTYILLRVVPRVPQQGRLQHAVARWIGRRMADAYLRAITRLVNVDPAILSLWTLVNAAERLYHGLASEQKELLHFVASTVDALRKNRGERVFYTRL